MIPAARRAVIGAVAGFLASSAPAMTRALRFPLAALVAGTAIGATSSLLFTLPRGGSWVEALITGLLYGGVTALTFLVLEQRYARCLPLDPRNAARERQRSRPAGYCGSCTVVLCAWPGRSAPHSVGVSEGSARPH